MRNTFYAILLVLALSACTRTGIHSGKLVGFQAVSESVPTRTAYESEFSGGAGSVQPINWVAGSCYGFIFSIGKGASWRCIPADTRDNQCKMEAID